MKPNKRGKDFKVLSLRLNENSVHSHVIYIKEHTVRDHSNATPAGRTLLVLNVPPYADKEGLTNAFSDVGNIQNIIFTQTPSTLATESDKFIQNKPEFTFKLAFIVFEKVSDLDKALNLNQLKPLSRDRHYVKLGMTKWIEEYNSSIESSQSILDHVNTFMSEHDKKTVLAEQKEKQLEEADDEGWITVTKGGKTKSFARSEKVENKILAKEERKKSQTQLKNFYTFQIRETRMKKLVELRQKYEEDKMKITKMKEKRRFRPF